MCGMGKLVPPTQKIRMKHVTAQKEQWKHFIIFTR